MQFLLDNIAATLVAGTVLLMLAAIQFRSQQSSWEAHKLYTLRAKQVVFIDFLRNDLNGVTSVQSVEEDSVSLSFTFTTRIAGDTTKHNVVYERVQTDVIGDIPVYEVQRQVDGVQSGKSLGRLTGWKIEARNAEGAKIVNPGNARQIYVRFDVLSPLADKEAVPTRRWEATFRPISLRGNQKI